MASHQNSATSPTRMEPSSVSQTSILNIFPKKISAGLPASRLSSTIVRSKLSSSVWKWKTSWDGKKEHRTGRVLDLITTCAKCGSAAVPPARIFFLMPGRLSRYVSSIFSTGKGGQLLEQEREVVIDARPPPGVIGGIRLSEFLLELSNQIILSIHDVQVLVLVPVPFVLLILTGAADVVEDLPQFIALGWPCRMHISSTGAEAIESDEAH
ncbi:hypothetical protein EYF80_017022 [Liparis tanakae]|uniref:Uncharacterized protein n=1 Tax=Liparis tanakae TaxID=230148 RepID=A0A4Z2I457_9TELE|nr:hypothetical protein EYF80_017022 [Liparis tanakae]